MSDLIRRQDAIDECDKQYPNIDRQDFKAVINAVPSAEVVLQTPQTYGKSINPNTEIVSDLISRQDVYHILEKAMIDRPLDSDRWVIRDIDKAIRSLPSADRPTGEWISEELANMICNEICYYKEVTVDADSLNDLCEGCLIKKMKYGRPTGEWVLDPNGMDWNIPAWRCSECGFIANYIGVEVNGFGKNPMNWVGSKFCPNCGAKMYKGGEEE